MGDFGAPERREVAQRSNERPTLERGARTGSVTNERSHAGGEGSASDEPQPSEENRRADERGHQRDSDDFDDLGEVAGRRVTVTPVDECRLLLGAEILRLPAPGAEAAA